MCGWKFGVDPRWLIQILVCPDFKYILHKYVSGKHVAIVAVTYTCTFPTYKELPCIVSCKINLLIKGDFLPGKIAISRV